MLYMLEKRSGVKDLFRCECGSEKMINRYNVRNGKVSSCGCLKKDMLVKRNKEELSKHNLSGTKLFMVWDGIKKRTKDKSNKNYGGRGISICSEWENDFKSFYDWSMENGYSEGLQIDRINNDGNYEPSNCRWVTPRKNCMNKRTNIDEEIMAKAEKMHKEGRSILSITNELGVKYSGVYQRLTGRRGSEKVTSIIKDKK